MPPALAALVLAASPAYIHFAPADLFDFCRMSSNVRVLEVTKFDPDSGVIVFEVADTLKGKGAKAITSFKQVIDPKAAGMKPFFDWLKAGKRAVLFSGEADNTQYNPPQGSVGCGYVVIDGFWYSVDYNFKGGYWAFLRADPHLSAVYHGDAAKLVPIVEDILDGKKPDIPTRKPETVPTKEERFKEVNDRLVENRK